MATLLDLAAAARLRRLWAVGCRGVSGDASAASPPPDCGEFVVADAGVALGEALIVGLGAFAFEGPMRRALGRLKYAGAARAAEPLGAAAAPAALRRISTISGSGAVPGPGATSRGRRRERGYNQASLLAGGRWPDDAGCRSRTCLDRRAATERQHRLDRAARLRNLRGAISVRDGAVVPRIVIVVDDILTTSATIEACAAVLEAGGAHMVYGFTIASEV